MSIQDSAIEDSAIEDSAVEDSAVDMEDPGPAPLCGEPTCIDEQFANGFIGVDETPNPGLITNSEEGTDFISVIDTSAEQVDSIYARFTPTGLEKVEISADEAFESGDWHIAFRRMDIRVNSGVSGPGCVEVGRVANMSYEEVESIPEALPFYTEEYMSETCEMVPHSSTVGVGTVLSSYWDYNFAAHCLKMMGHTYLLKLSETRTIKLIVEGYYPLDIQAQCDADEIIPSDMGGTTTIRWSEI